MFNIITFRRNNPLTFIPARRKNKIKNREKYLICHRHHIIPQYYFKFHNISIDNSSNNVICLLKNEHIKIHRLLEQYYETKHIMNHEIYFLCMQIEKLQIYYVEFTKNQITVGNLILLNKNKDDAKILALELKKLWH